MMGAKGDHGVDPFAGLQEEAFEAAFKSVRWSTRHAKNLSKYHHHSTHHLVVLDTLHSRGSRFRFSICPP